MKSLIPCLLIALPLHAAQLLTNTGFETAPFPTGWTASGAVSVAGLNGTTTAARLPYNTSASLSQQPASAVADFTAELSFQIAGTDTAQAFRLVLDAGAAAAIELRTTTGGVLQVNVGGTFYNLTRIADGATFAVPTAQTVKLGVIGRGFGTSSAEYDVAWSNAGSATLAHAVTGLRPLATAAVSRVRFPHDLTLGNSYTVDDVTLTDSASAPPAADFQLVLPAADKVVNISGVYPHLAMSNSSNECGTGAVVPWAGKLWAITYGPHLPNGSDDKLFEIAPDLSRIVRPESIGGTPANRFIHTASNQLLIGPYFIDAARNVRTIGYASAPGRYTGNAAHLTDPNRVYLFTMEDGLYDLNASDLSFITRYPDVQGTGDSFLAGYHGKGAYSAQGKLFVANNGEPGATYPSGVLASWDGSVRGAGDANPQRMTAWTQEFRVQHCEVTGPGDLRGNTGANDPVWATGFDAKSVVLRTYEAGQWTTWRLPKGSYTHDAPHGWYTEWPRIRELDPATPGGPWLMHMHGLFYSFPPTFSAANFAGLTPLCAYEKMPVDYCTFGGRLVIGKNDTSRFSNALVPRAQSNLWWGQLGDLAKWGAPHGHGCVWLSENVAATAVSEPFLVNGFSRATLHLRHTGASAVGLEIQTSDGSGAWSSLRTVSIPASGYLSELLNDSGAQWIRLRANSAATNLTAHFILANPYPHPAATNEFAALAGIADTTGLTDGIIRTVNASDLPLELAASRMNASGTAAPSGYHKIGGPLTLAAVTDATAENTLRTAAALTQDFGSDAASAWITVGAAKLRLPKLDAAYDSAFASGWARGIREVVTERQMLNCHGTFYEVPRDDAGGRRRLKPIATHGKRITDFASWRGLLVLTGVLDAAPASDRVVRSANGNGALWLGEIDDLWRMGEPRGNGGPWLGTAVTAGTASDAYLMYGYDRKVLSLAHTGAASVTFTVEVDFLGDNTWSPYGTFAVAAGQTFTHVFPSGFHAHWVRVKSDAATTATAQFTYGPAPGTFAEWQSKTWPGVTAPSIISPHADPEKDGIANLLEYALNLAPTAPDPLPFSLTRSGANLDYSYLRSLLALNSGVTFSVEWSDTLAENSWSTTGVSESILGTTGTMQTVKASVAAGAGPARFLHLKVSLP